MEYAESLGFFKKNNGIQVVPTNCSPDRVGCTIRARLLGVQGIAPDPL